MKRLHALFIALLLACSAAAEQTATFGRFGEVALYGDARTANQVVLLISGDGGWNEGEVDMARDLASAGALVIDIDIRRYLPALAKAKDACAYPAADFEALSQAMQKKLALPRYHPPLLIGYSSGATLAFATLAQSPPNTFSGAVSFGFCPDLRFARPLCSGSGLRQAPSTDSRVLRFAPGPLPARWIVLQGELDRVCSPAQTAMFVAQATGASLVELPGVGHGFSRPANWLPQLRAAVASFAIAANEKGGDTEVGDLPLVEVPAKGDGDTLAVIVSGDGGWASIDKSLGETLAAQGVAVVGLNSLQYFWKKRDANEAGRDLERVLRHYGKAWKRERFMLIGYSSGADVLPFMASRLPADLLSRVRLVALLSPATRASFEFHVSQWIGSSAAETFPVEPEIEKLAGSKVLCIYGDRESDSLCRQLGSGLAEILVRRGGHHYDGDFRALAAEILNAAR